MYVIQEIRDRLRRWFGGDRLKNAKVRRVLLGGLFFALLTFLLMAQVSPKRLDLKANDLAPMDLEAPRDIENRVATDRKRQTEMAAVPILKKSDATVLRQAEEYIIHTFQEVETVRNLPNQDEATRVETLMTRVNAGGALPRELYADLLRLNERVLAIAQQDALRLIRFALSDNIPAEAVADLRAKVDQEALGVALVTEEPRFLRTFIKELVKSRIRSNQVDDLEATQRLKEEAANSVAVVIIKKGECCIIEKNKRVTEEQYTMLQDLGLIGPRADVRSLVGTSLLALLLVSLIGLYLSRYHPQIVEKDSKLLLLGLIGVLTLLLALLMRSFQDSLGPGVGYLMPIAFHSMLVAILLDSRVALVQSAFLALLAAMFTDADQLNHILVLLVGSVAGIYAVSRVESRTDIYRAGLQVAAVNVCAILALYLIQAFSLLDRRVWIDAGLGALNGLVVAVLVTGALPLFENLFGIVTPLKLLELSNPNHALLRKLLVEAPGSYHHTILVANLCEAAAEAIGADQVLTRVGAYYHDIGKAKRPYFFVENQVGGENPHDKLPPSLSAMIITSHVRDGIEMAREAGLPQEIVDFIPEHHGTTLVSYFYHMASKTGQSEYVLEEDFRYDGPKPRRKETAICMLADGCEASVRAMRQKGHLTVDQIEAQVKRIVEDRLRQGQLENCDLTLRDLEMIQKTFVKMLSGVHHARIDYPPEAIAGRLPATAASLTGHPKEERPLADVGQQRAGEGHVDRGAGGDDESSPAEGA